MTTDTRRAADILAYWHAVEMFDPRDIPEVRETARRRQGERCVEQFRLVRGNDGDAPPLPWEPTHPRFDEQPAAGKFGSEWRHTVYGGIFSYRAVREAFARTLGYDEKPDYGGTRRDSESALFAFAVDQRGALIEDTAVLSSCLWATGRLHRPGPGAPGWLDGFEKAARDCAEAVRRLVGGGRESGKVVRADDVGEFSALLAEWLFLPEGITDHQELRVVSVPVFKRKDGTLTDPEPVFLSSLIAPDIQRVRDEADTGYGAALASYLGEPRRRADQVDLARDRGALLDGVRPASFPLARWPADTGTPLNVSQQFAVNTILAELAGNRGGGGLFSVNGPPGTGKTTLLRDLIAAIIVRRAEALATLKEPGEAFTKGDTAWRVKPELTGFEIVVASANNAAVENVTTELPALTAIGADWQAEADYFGAQATVYSGAPAWGAVAAPLGKAENRARFRERFWYADGGMFQVLRDCEPENRDPLSAEARLEAWQAAVDRFKTALRHARRLARDRDIADTALRSPVSAEAAGAARRDAARRDGARRDAARHAAMHAMSQTTVEHSFPVPLNWTQLPQDAQELTAPWSDEEWTAARTRVFLAALGLHAAFVTGAAGQVMHNVGHVLGTASRDSATPKGEDLRAVWQTLFLLVPVISTTFASCGRMFGALGRESLGWLLIDEAGQALPQAAVGALWRSRRAVVVGDPLQLEPISQVPEEVQERLRGLFGPGVGAEWQPSAVSAQVLADRRNTWGTAISRKTPQGDEEVWVGAPLRVHRRCEEPMFGISNAIAYGGLMVYATAGQPFPGGSYPDYPRSSWVDVGGVVGGPSEGKWVPAQGDALVAILRRLRDRSGVGLNRIYVLSPFRDVVARSRLLVRREILPAPDETDALRDFADTHIGTVHTMQGKEADVVILILGTDPSPGKKARDWAGQPVNLLNVAVSRARRRLFVIGDHAEWSGAPNFPALAGRLPRVRWQGHEASGRIGLWTT